MHIISIAVNKRKEDVPDVQKILTDFGENIISRLGLHNIGKNKNGLIVIVYEGQDVEQFIEKLNMIKDIEVKNMKIS